MTATRTCGQALVRLLADYGVDTVFGIPGTHTIELYRGLAGGSPRHILPRHEQGAGFIADGYARVSGRPGVCFVITGPGVTNIATAIGQAYSDSVPMLVFSSVLATADRGRGYGRLHEISDQRAVTAPLTAFSATATSVAEVPELVARAFAVFESTRPRPVHIELPLDIIGAPAAGVWTRRPASAKPLLDATLIGRAGDLLKRAERPVVIVGGGAARAADSIRRIVDILGSAVVTTVAGKGIVPDGHPLSLGALLPQAAAVEVVSGADVVLAVGTELAETDHWLDRLPISGRIIRVDIDAAKLTDTHAPEIAIHADAAAAAEMLADGLSPGRAAAATEETKGRIAAIRDSVAAGESRLRRQHRRVLDILRAQLPADAVVTSDMTQIAYSGNQIFPTTMPGTWLHPVGFSTLGFALPTAMGAKLAAPDRAVVAIAGDAGFLFTVQELATAVELGLSLPVILWNNEALGEIRDQMIERGVEPVGVVSRNPDFQALAVAFGCHAARPDSSDELAAAITAALNHPGVTVIELRQDAAWIA